MTESVSERDAESPAARNTLGGADESRLETAGIDAKVLLGESAKIESSTPGGFLRGERERQERQLQQVADELHLSRSAIEAIEGNRFTEFGAPVFAKGHLRRYATLLGVAADEVLARYEQLGESARAHESLPPAARSHEPTRRVELTREASGLRIAPRAPGSGFRWMPMGAIAIIAALAAAGVWWWMEARDVPVAAPAATPTESTSELPDEATLSQAAEIAATSRAIETPQLSQSAQPAQSAAAPVVEQRAAPASASPLPGKVRVRLIFKQDSWAEVYDGRGNRMMYDVGRSDLPRIIDADPPVQVVLGYAPAVDIEINGVAKPVPERRINNSVARFAVQADGSIQ